MAGSGLIRDFLRDAAGAEKAGISFLFKCRACEMA
jgi:hypothetical protein